MNRVEQLLSFLKQAPSDPFLNHALALEYIKVGDDTTAQVYFDRNFQQVPDYVATYYHLGKLLERAGKTEEAIKVYEQGMIEAKTAKDNHSYNELQGAYEDLVY